MPTHREPIRNYRRSAASRQTVESKPPCWRSTKGFASNSTQIRCHNSQVLDTAYDSRNTCDCHPLGASLIFSFKLVHPDLLWPAWCKHRQASAHHGTPSRSNRCPAPTSTSLWTHHKMHNNVTSASVPSDHKAWTHAQLEQHLCGQRKCTKAPCQPGSKQANILHRIDLEQCTPDILWSF